MGPRNDVLGDESGVAIVARKVLVSRQRAVAGDKDAGQGRNAAVGDGFLEDGKGVYLFQIVFAVQKHAQGVGRVLGSGNKPDGAGVVSALDGDGFRGQVSHGESEFMGLWVGGQMRIGPIGGFRNAGFACNFVTLPDTSRIDYSPDRP